MSRACAAEVECPSSQPVILSACSEAEVARSHASYVPRPPHRMPPPFTRHTAGMSGFWSNRPVLVATNCSIASHCRSPRLDSPLRTCRHRGAAVRDWSAQANRQVHLQLLPTRSAHSHISPAVGASVGASRPLHAPFFTLTCARSPSKFTRVSPMTSALAAAMGPDSASSIPTTTGSSARQATL